MSHVFRDLLWLPPESEHDHIVAGDQISGLEIRRLAGHRLSGPATTDLAGAISGLQASGQTLRPLIPLRLAVASNCTCDFLLDHLVVGAARHGVAVELNIAPFDQVTQQALDSDSQINTAEADAILLVVDRHWAGLDRAAYGPDADRALNRARDALLSVIDGFSRHASAPIIIPTLVPAPTTLFGSYDRAMPGSPLAMTEAFNRFVVETVAGSGNYLLDVAAIAERVGSDEWHNPAQWHQYRMPFRATCNAIYGDVVGRLLGAIRGRSRKCLVLDLDNTLWGGAVGDDGLDGLKLGPGSAEGEAFLAVQRMALDLRERGVILAVSSKNDHAIAWNAFCNHSEMILKENDIAVFQANWEGKPVNIQAIAKTLNIDLDAVVLLDDNPAERAHVRAASPTVAVPELPEMPDDYPTYLLSAGYFEAIGFSDDDRIRAQTYKANHTRIEVLSQATSVKGYLESLEMAIDIKPFDTAGRFRIAQLTNKSNQFNLTTRRYTEMAVQQIADDPAIYARQVRLRDRYGDYGMISVIIARPASEQRDAWDIDTWLMSCRALGRRVEEAILIDVVRGAQMSGVSRLSGTYIPSGKNSMVCDHYEKLGFALIDVDQAGIRRYELQVGSFVEPTLPFVSNLEGSTRAYDDANGRRT